MKPTTKLIVCAFAALALTACKDEEIYIPIGQSIESQTGDDENTNEEITEANKAYASSSLDVPELKSGSVLVVHRAVINDKASSKVEVNYAVEWDPTINAQRWSCYKLYKNALQINVSRYTASNNETLTSNSQYPNDPDIASKYRMTVDPYKSSGYDHGHICPSADRQGSFNANYQTFYLTNMQPQYNSFNAGVWSDMEAKVREWAKSSSCDTLYVAKGGTIDKAENIYEWICNGSHQKTKVNANHIPVPKYYFMAVMSRKGNDLKAIGFWVEYNATNKTLSTYVKTIDQLEELTGINFFKNVPEAQQTEVESSFGVLSDWNL